jgi:hypothetical protein
MILLQSLLHVFVSAQKEQENAIGRSSRDLC